MAHHGQIEYLDLDMRDVEWDRSVRFVEDKASNAVSNQESDGYVLEARVRRLQDCEIKPKDPKHVIRDRMDNEIGHLCFDTQPGEDSTEVRCAIMGRESRREDGKRKYYVLFVTECAMPPGCGKFERVGMGSIQQRFIRFDSQDDAAQIL
jgi:hypothetical protein